MGRVCGRAVIQREQELFLGDSRVLRRAHDTIRSSFFAFTQEQKVNVDCG